MKICFVTNFFPPEGVGGVEVYTLGVARTLQARGHQVGIFSGGTWDQGECHIRPPREGSFDSLPVTRLDLNWRLAPDPNRYLYDNPDTAAAFKQYLQVTRPDLVHVMSTYTVSASVIPAAKALGLPVLVTLHDYWFLCPALYLVRSDGSQCDGHVPVSTCLQCMSSASKAYQWPRRFLPEGFVLAGLEKIAHLPQVTRQRGFLGMVADYAARRQAIRRALAQVDQFLVPSPFLKTLFASHGEPFDRLQVVEEGIDTSWYTGTAARSKSPQVRFGYIGQVLPIKGVHTLVSAFRQVRAPASLTIFGNLEQEPHYRAQLRALAGDDRRITFAGRFQRQQLESVLASLDVLVVPSLWQETFNIVAREALQCGLPLVVSDLGGLRDAVRQGENGFRFPAGDSDALAALLSGIATKPHVLAGLKPATHPIRLVTQEVDQLETIYNSTIRLPLVETPVEVSV